jgi:hypothetical protein
MRASTRRWILLGAGLSWASPALAVDPPPEGNAAIAEALFRHGRELLDAGKVTEACEKFAASQRADPALGTLLNLAACHERDGRTATAWSEFTDAYGEASRAHDKRASYAQSRLVALEKNLYRVIIEVADPPAELVVRLDGQALGREALGTPLPVNPGERTIDASAPGRQSWTRKLAVPRTAGQERIAIPVLAVMDAPPPPRPAPAIQAEPPPPPAVANEADHAVWSRRRVGLGVAAGGVAATTVGVIFGVKAMSRNDDSKKHCQQNVCDPTGVKLNSDARSAATASTVFFGVGLAALGAGAWLMFVPPGKSTTAAVAPTAGGATVTLAGRF